MEQTSEVYKIPVYEIFGPTIQGEGLHAGRRCMFVRTCLCNDHCSWCDSKYAWTTDNAKWMTQEEIFEAVKGKGCDTVILTGGNPCIHNFKTFCILCRKAGMKVEVETQGGVYPQWLIDTNLITFSPKVPSAGKDAKDHRDSIYEWLEAVPGCWELDIVIKIPIFDDIDIEFAKQTFAAIRKRFECRKEQHKFHFYLSVGNDNTLSTDFTKVRDSVLADYFVFIEYLNAHPEGFEDVSILPQIHTLIWGNKEGV